MGGYDAPEAVFRWPVGGGYKTDERSVAHGSDIRAACSCGRAGTYCACDCAAFRGIEIFLGVASRLCAEPQKEITTD